ncbi:ATP-dependent Clp protease ATP-binding subunit ClpA [Prevotella sp. E13-17]|uniref:ATP-dependent Clp protease ATP-binding subunit ClpA n=1 Tax=Prevotella sp. E13-17 TaxID=2913616 RepID=UPI001EDB9A9B|nr:ATP-dependent Clp protease ATP-binding subunit ClpA [Prevotella sp. E13-17]UKK50448.1 ATP-dependent Clp protease ATP-binding subunit ClpA [Prevotella sp. E13-17]
MAEIRRTKRATRTLEDAVACCETFRHEFVMPEHLLLALLNDVEFQQTLNLFYSAELLKRKTKEKLAEVEFVPNGCDYDPEISVQLAQIINIAWQQVTFSSANEIDVTHLVTALLQLEDSWAAYLLKDALGEKESNFISLLIDGYELEDHLNSDFNEDDEDDDLFDDYDKHHELAWRQLVTCMNELYEKHNPLIGRDMELARTIQVLCRRDKNNPLHIGEPGVGKTALVWGLARMIAEGRVPDRLKESRIYQLDLGTLLAGTQYRGDFENRIKMIMDGIRNESEANIVYIDEIHTLVGAGATGEGAMDASNMLKPYLEAGSIRFIGSTTYEEYNRHFSRSKGLVRRFQQIDIPEPSPEETKHILRQLQPNYEAFHHVKYDSDAIDFAVDASAKYVNDRFLPDKAIDLIDEAGAAYESKRAEGEPEDAATATVTKADIAEVLAKTCKVDALAVNETSEHLLLEQMAPKMLAKIYGQDEAISQVVEAVQMAHAGLLDDNKPVASLLFVGPTGVGKTEVARMLARVLGIELVRFDMSEYTEKHTVAKLIGSPAGYVGYEDGGLLTDAIRKTPNCVLLLDEIEKAHQDIYNILLQVMDYARLTDNKGRKADFRNAILIMTSNAGAQYAGQAAVGFTGGTSRGAAMLRQVKKTFKPEFINRLSGTVVFNDMDEKMARLILDKKLDELREKLSHKHVTMTLSDEAFDLLLKEGFTQEYGAREMDRIIAHHLKPLLTREILFGSMKQGGNINITTDHGHLSIG